MPTTARPLCSTCFNHPRADGDLRCADCRPTLLPPPPPRRRPRPEEDR